jgi:leucyl-tRNA synthetase
VSVDATADRTAIEAATLASDIFLRHAEGRTAKKVVVVPGRLVNVVI